MVPQVQLNPTIRTCMENLYIYIIPPESMDADSHSSMTVYLSHLAGKFIDMVIEVQRTRCAQGTSRVTS